MWGRRDVHRLLHATEPKEQPMNIPSAPHVPHSSLYSDVNTGGTMRQRIPHLMFFAVLTTAAYAQPSRWATADDKTAKFMIDMERKWAEGVCKNNGVISELLADDFQGTNTGGERYNKVDELRDEKDPRSAHGCALDDAKVRFFSSSSSSP